MTYRRIETCSMNLMQWKVDRWQRQRKKDSWPFPSPCGTGVFPAWIYRPTVCMATLDTTSTVYCNFAHGRLLFPAGIFAAHRHHRHHRCTQARYVSISPSIHFSVTLVDWTAWNGWIYCPTFLINWRCYTISYFTRARDDGSQLNLLHGTKTLKNRKLKRN